MPKTPLVFAQLDDEFVVLPRVCAETRARQAQALASANSWKDLLKMDPDMSSEWIRETLGLSKRDFRLTDPVNLEGLMENGYPTPIGADVHDWLSGEGLERLFDKYGTVESSALGEDLPALKAEYAQVIVDRLSKLGYECSEDAKLVRLAAGC